MDIDDLPAPSARCRSARPDREAYLRHRMGQALDRLTAETSLARKRVAARWATAWCRALQIEKKGGAKSVPSFTLHSLS